MSPPAISKGRVSPPSGKGRLSPPSSKAGRDLAKHRRSPTAPEPSSVKESNGAAAAGAHPIGKTWAGADKGEREEEYEHGVASSGERERERAARRADRRRRLAAMFDEGREDWRDRLRPIEVGEGAVDGV